MDKFLGPLIGGIIVGAAASEIISRRHSKALRKLRRNVTRNAITLCWKTIDTLSDAKESFAEGYRSATQTPRTAEVRA